MQLSAPLVRSNLQAYADPALALPMKKYMRNLSEFFGLKSPQRREVSKEILQVYGKPQWAAAEKIARELWTYPERECHYFAMELIELYKKEWGPELLPLCEFLITHNSWWDTVDFIAPKLAGAYFLRHPQDMVATAQKWNRSDNMWLQRSSIILQLNYKKKTNVGLLFENIRNCTGSKEFFIQKAIGWSLRQYARTDAETVREFVASTDLKPLSRREAMKHLG